MSVKFSLLLDILPDNLLQCLTLKWERANARLGPASFLVCVLVHGLDHDGHLVAQGVPHPSPSFTLITNFSPWNSASQNHLPRLSWIFMMDVSSLMYFLDNKTLNHSIPLAFLFVTIVKNFTVKI